MSKLGIGMTLGYPRIAVVLMWKGQRSVLKLGLGYSNVEWVSVLLGLSFGVYTIRVTISCIYYFAFTVSLYFMHSINLSGYLAASVYIKPVGLNSKNACWFNLCCFVQTFLVAFLSVLCCLTQKFGTYF